MVYRVLIVEDDPMAQQLFTMFVEQSEEFELLAAIDNADLADLYCENRKVDMILMDVRTSMHANGLDAAERIKKKHPEIKIIIVTSMPEISYLQRAKEIGADGMWYKEVRSEPFLSLMHRTMMGEKIFPDSTPVVTLGNAKSTDFTDRELEVLRELVTGATNLAIAGKLYLSERTVKAHIQSMLEKTGYGNRTELAVRAMESGIVINDSHI